MRHFYFLLTALLLSSPSTSAKEYTDGVFFVNEDWYGHQNSTINFLHPDDPDGNYWDYRIFQTENPGYELGCTNQYGAIHDGRLFLIAKQERDPGASITGGRITVANATNLKMLYQSTLIDPSGNQCDGRGFVGWDSHKGYISSSHGVWIFNLDDYTVTSMVRGTENPNGYSDGGNTNSAGALYHGQCGSMVRAVGYIFVAHQEYGLLRINPSTDEVDRIFTIADKTQEGAGIGSVVLAANNRLYLSVTKDTGGLGDMLPYLIEVDPETMDYRVINVPDPYYPPASSWYAWTPDGFCASARKNVLYWNGGFNSWFSGSMIFKYDIDSNTFTKIIDLVQEGGSSPWKLYGCSMRVHPETEELYMSLFHEFATPIYITRRTDSEGNKIKDYSMIQNYWFPSLPVFTVKEGQGIDDIHTQVIGITHLGGTSLSITGAIGQQLLIYSLQGLEVFSTLITDESMIIDTNIPHGMYIARVADRSLKFIIQ